MTLEAFGKEIDINLEMNQQTIKNIVVGVSILIIIGIAVGLIVPKGILYSKKSKELDNLKIQYTKAQAEYNAERATVDKLKNIYAGQQLNLEKLKDRFKEASLSDESDLVEAIFLIMRYLNLKYEYSRPEIAEVKKGYVKIYMPLEVEGEFYQVSRLFYLLENSKNWLLTFKGSNLEMIKKEEGKKLGVKFNIGAYLLQGGEIDFE